MNLRDLSCLLPSTGWSLSVTCSPAQTLLLLPSGSARFVSSAAVILISGVLSFDIIPAYPSFSVSFVKCYFM